jgi:hypothetical protein
MKSRIYITYSIILLAFIYAGCWGDRPVSLENLNKSPDLPGNPNPPDNSVNIARFVTLGWTCTDPDNDTLTYDVYMDYSNPPLIMVAQGISLNSFASSLLQPNAIVFWKITAKDNHNGSTEGHVWHFTTTN